MFGKSSTLLNTEYKRSKPIFSLIFIYSQHWVNLLFPRHSECPFQSFHFKSNTLAPVGHRFRLMKGDEHFQVTIKASTIFVASGVVAKIGFNL